MASSQGLVPSGMAEYPSSAALYAVNSCAVEFSRTRANPMMPYSAGPGYAQHYAPSEYVGGSYNASNSDMAPREDKKYSSDAVPTRRRKIIIRPIQPRASESQIRDLIRHKAGSAAAEKLQRLDIPLADGAQGLNRGFALATFETEEMADKVIKELNNYQHGGRILEVKHAKEGASDHHSSHSSRSHGSNHQRHSHQSQHPHRERHERHERPEGKEGKERKGREKESSHKSASSGDKKSKFSPSKPEVIIANGSSQRPKC
jgi:hypothetical protein